MHQIYEKVVKTFDYESINIELKAFPKSPEKKQASTSRHLESHQNYEPEAANEGKHLERLGKSFFTSCKEKIASL